MAGENKGATNSGGDPANTGTPEPKPQGAASNAGGGAHDPAEPVTLTRAQLQELQNRADRRERLRRAKAEETAQALARELETLKQGQMTEAQRQVADAEKRTREAVERELTERHAVERRSWALQRALMAKGADPDAWRMIDAQDLDPDNADAVKEAVDALLERKPNLVLNAQAPEPGPATFQGGFPQRRSAAVASTGAGVVWPRSRIRAVIESGEYPKYRDEIVAAQREGRVTPN